MSELRRGVAQRMPGWPAALFVVGIVSTLASMVVATLFLRFSIGAVKADMGLVYMFALFSIGSGTASVRTWHRIYERAALTAVVRGREPRRGRGVAWALFAACALGPGALVVVVQSIQQWGSVATAPVPFTASVTFPVAVGSLGGNVLAELIGEWRYYTHRPSA